MCTTYLSIAIFETRYNDANKYDCEYTVPYITHLVSYHKPF